MTPDGDLAGPRVRPRSHAIAAVLAFWLAAAPVWLGLAPSAFAIGTANCSELNIHNRWQGQQSAGNIRQGASATFENYSLWQCSQPGFPIEISGSTVWTNIVPTDGSSWDIIQIGAGNCRGPACSAGMHYYYATGLSNSTPGCSGFQSSPPVSFEVGTWTAAAHQYRIEHVNNQWKFWVDTSNKAVLAEAALCWTPRSSVWFGESFDYGDQIGGTLTNKLSITNAAYMTTENGAWFATAFNAANPCNYQASFDVFHCDVTGARSFDIWTDR